MPSFLPSLLLSLSPSLILQRLHALDLNCGWQLSQMEIMPSVRPFRSPPREEGRGGRPLPCLGVVSAQILPFRLATSRRTHCGNAAAAPCKIIICFSGPRRRRRKSFFAWLANTHSSSRQNKQLGAQQQESAAHSPFFLIATSRYDKIHMRRASGSDNERHVN